MDMGWETDGLTVTKSDKSQSNLRADSPTLPGQGSDSRPGWW